MSAIDEKLRADAELIGVVRTWNQSVMPTAHAVADALKLSNALIGKLLEMIPHDDPCLRRTLGCTCGRKDRIQQALSLS